MDAELYIYIFIFNDIYREFYISKQNTFHLTFFIDYLDVSKKILIVYRDQTNTFC